MTSGLLDTSVVVDWHDPDVEATLEPIQFDGAAARSYGLVVAAVAQRGRTPRRRFADLMIAATAPANGLDLYARNGRDLLGIADLVRVIEV